jgi:hypothetical protein
MPFLETLHDQLRDALAIVDRRTARRELWTTPQTGPEALLLGLLRRVEKAAVRLLWRFRGTDRPAINIGRGDANEKHAVESRITRGQGVVKPAAVLVHASSLRQPPALRWPFSDMTIIAITTSENGEQGRGAPLYISGCVIATGAAAMHTWTGRQRPHGWAPSTRPHSSTDAILVNDRPH